MNTRLVDKIPQYQRYAAQVGIKPAEFWEMTPGEFDTWIAGYAEREKVLDRRTAQVCQAIFENHRNHKSRPRPYKVEDFMPRYGQESKPAQTPEQMLSLLKAMFGSREKVGGDNGD